eukprot:3497625-Rhodomonas_salina.4
MRQKHAGGRRAARTRTPRLEREEKRVEPSRQLAMKHEKTVPKGTGPPPMTAMRRGGHWSTKMYIAPSKNDWTAPTCGEEEDEVSEEDEKEGRIEGGKKGGRGRKSENKARAVRRGEKEGKMTGGEGVREA